MIVPLDTHTMLTNKPFLRARQHVLSIFAKHSHPHYDAKAMAKVWKEEFGIELIMDPTGTGINGMRFESEKEYMLWLLKWG